MNNDCIFCKIVQRTIPAKWLYEDELIIAFPDINPQAPVHILVVPKVHIASLAQVRAEHEKALGRMLSVADRLAAENGSPEGCRVIINNRTIGHQEVFHLHMHIFGGEKPLGRMLSK